MKYLLFIKILVFLSSTYANQIDWKNVEENFLKAQQIYNQSPTSYEATLEDELRGVNCWGTLLYIMGASSELTFGTEFETQNFLNSNYCKLVKTTRNTSEKFKPGQIIRFHEDPLRETHISLIGKDSKYWHKMSPNQSDLILREDQDNRFQSYFDGTYEVFGRSFPVPMNDIYVYECANLSYDSIEARLMSLYKRIESTKRVTDELSQQQAILFFRELKEMGNYENLKLMTTLQLRNSYFVIFQLLSVFYNQDKDPTVNLRNKLVSEILSRSDFIKSIDVMLNRMHPHDLQVFINHLIKSSVSFTELPILIRKNVYSAVLKYGFFFGFNDTNLSYIDSTRLFKGSEKDCNLNS